MRGRERGGREKEEEDKGGKGEEKGGGRRGEQKKEERKGERMYGKTERRREWYMHYWGSTST